MSTSSLSHNQAMDPEERARRREERRRKREEESAAAETNGPSEETEEEAERRARRERRARERAGLSNDTEEEDDSERLRQEEEERREREEAERRRRQEEEKKRRLEEQRREEEERQKQEEEKRKREEEKKRNAEIERQRQEDLKKQEETKNNPHEEAADARADAPADAPAEKPKKKLNLLGKVSKGRKKEILAMMLKKARGDLQLEEQEAAAERVKYITENVKDVNIDSMNKDQLRKLCEEIHTQLQTAEGEKFDLEIKVKRRDLQISNLKVKANETRGRFTMPTLKQVSKKVDSPKPKETERKDFRGELKKAEPAAAN